MVGNQQKSRWSANVTAHSDALELEPKVFEKDSAGEIAASLKRSAESSDRRKTSAFRSAMSMLTFYINRAGRNLPTNGSTSSKRRKKNCASCSDAIIERGLARRVRSSMERTPGADPPEEGAT